MIMAYVIFMGSKNKAVESIPINTYVAGDNIYYDMQDILFAQKAEQLEKQFKRYNKLGLFNGTVIYGENGQEVYKGSYGYADFRKKDNELIVDEKFTLFANKVSIDKYESLYRFINSINNYQKKTKLLIK